MNVVLVIVMGIPKYSCVWVTFAHGISNHARGIRPVLNSHNIAASCVLVVYLSFDGDTE